MTLMVHWSHMVLMTSMSTFEWTFARLEWGWLYAQPGVKAGEIRRHGTTS